MKRRSLFLVVLMLCVGSSRGEIFSHRLRVLAYTVAQDPARSAWNPNNVLGLSRYQVISELRPDLAIDLGRVGLDARPRLRAAWERWEDGIRRDDDELDTEAFIHEWGVRLRVLAALELSYGREDLQWGPSCLLSPSNPFSTWNGRDAPESEPPGMDYGKLTWTIGPSWTVTAIANTDDGRQRRIPFRKHYALKVDRVRDGVHLAGVLGKREGGDPRTGGFASWNATSALILYVEASHAARDTEVLIGESYTFLSGCTVMLEYLYNERGNPVFAFDLDDPMPAAREILTGRSYSLVQAVYPDALGEWDLLARAVANLDDGSRALLVHGETNVGDYVRTFVNGTVTGGGYRGELSSLLDYRLMVGLEAAF